MYEQQDFGRFEVHAITASEWARQLSYTKNMLLAAVAASLSIVGAGAFFLSFWL